MPPPTSKTSLRPALSYRSATGLTTVDVRTVDGEAAARTRCPLVFCNACQTGPTEPVRPTGADGRKTLPGRWSRGRMSEPLGRCVSVPATGLRGFYEGGCWAASRWSRRRRRRVHAPLRAPMLLRMAFTVRSPRCRNGARARTESQPPDTAVWAASWAVGHGDSRLAAPDLLRPSRQGGVRSCIGAAGGRRTGASCRSVSHVRRTTVCRQRLRRSS